VSEELKPCPFCGGAARYTYNDFYNNNSMAQCVSCGASAFWKKWNERADAGKDAALTDERAKEIAQQVHAECSRIPGATFYNAAISAIEQAVKERK
jgi:hypothetical protein